MGQNQADTGAVPETVQVSGEVNLNVNVVVFSACSLQPWCEKAEAFMESLTASCLSASSLSFPLPNDMRLSHANATLPAKAAVAPSIKLPAF